MVEVKFLPNLLRRRQDPDSAIGRAISGSAAATSGMYGSVFSSFGGGWDVQKAVNDALEKVIWVFRCVDAIATNQAKLTMVKRTGDPVEGKIAKDSALARLLNQRANIYETSFDFRYRLSAQLLLSKRGAFVEVARNAAGVPRSVHLLPPHLVEPIPDPQTFVSGYRMLNQVAREEVILPPDKVIWLKVKPHPLDPYLQMTPMLAAGLAVETDFLARLFNRQFLLNDGRPGLLVAIMGKLSKQDAEEIKARFSGGPIGAGRTTVVEADDLNVADLGATPRDMQWLDAIRGSKEDILLAFGTPESILGNASGRTWDNADAEKENWWEETEQPHCNAVGRGLDPLTGDVNDDEFVSFNWDEVDVLQRRKRARHDKKAEEFKAGLATIDDYLDATGREPWGVPGTRALILPNGMVIARDEADNEAIQQYPIVGQPAQPGLAEQARAGAIAGTQVGTRQFENIIAARAHELSRVNTRISTEAAERFDVNGRARKHLPGDIEHKDVIDGEVVDTGHPYEADRALAEGQFQGVLDSWCEAQATIIPSRLDHVKIRRHTRHWHGAGVGVGTKALNPAYAVDTDRWINDLQAQMERFMARIGQDALKKTSKKMVDTGVASAMHAMDLGNPQARSDLDRVYGTRTAADHALSNLLGPLNVVIRDAARRQSDRVAQRVADLDADSASLTAIKDEVRSLIGARSTWRDQLARYLTTALMEGAKHHAYEQAGVLVDKTWNAVGDERVRHTHNRVAGTTRRMGRRFRVGRYWMRYPGDPAGGAEENSNCRCWLDYDISDEGAGFYDEYA